MKLQNVKIGYLGPKWMRFTRGSVENHVCFSIVSHPWMQTPLPLDTGPHPLDAEPLSPWMQTHTPLDADPLPQMQILPPEIRSTSRWYASYWNAYLFFVLRISKTLLLLQLFSYLHPRQCIKSMYSCLPSSTNLSHFPLSSEQGHFLAGSHEAANSWYLELYSGQLLRRDGNRFCFDPHWSSWMNGGRWLWVIVLLDIVDTCSCTYLSHRCTKAYSNTYDNKGKFYTSPEVYDEYQYFSHK